MPIARLRLAHRSRQHEAGTDRDVELELPALAAGPLASRVGALPVGTPIRATGFLAKTHRNARLLALHITTFEIIED